MTYKESLTAAMDSLAKNQKTVFIGYNTRWGSRANGTLVNVPTAQCIETPVAENLMAGMAVGMSLEGYLPVVYFERFDFILNAADAIVNHLDKMAMMSDGQFKPRAIIRVVVGSRDQPLFTGPTHTQDFTEAFQKLVSFPVIDLKIWQNGLGNRPHEIYKSLENANQSAMVIEHRELYQINFND